MSKDAAVSAERIEQLIYVIRGQRVMLDADLARVYGVSTKRLNEAVKRNQERFPEDFVFQITEEEIVCLRSQSVTSNDGAESLRRQSGISNNRCQTGAGPNRSQIATGSQKHRDPRFPPYAFTEHGAIMAANVLRSRRAVQMSVFVVRAFVRMRAALSDSRSLARKLAGLEKELKERLDVHEAAIVTILQRVMDIVDPPALPAPPKKDIGFRVRKSGERYRVRRKKRAV